MEIPKTKAGILIQFWSILSCLPNRSEYLDKYVASENRRVRYSAAATFSHTGSPAAVTWGDCMPSKEA